MNAERLLQYYEQIADAPDAIARLRRFILDLAVRGKLVAQDPADEPASELLKRIAAEKARLVKAGEIKQARHEPPDFGMSPNVLPASWTWTAFGDVQELIRGVTYSKSDVGDGPGEDYVPILRANNIGAILTHDEPVFVKRGCVSDEQFLKAGDFMIALSSGSKNLVGKAAFVPKDFQEAFGGFCGVIRLIDHDLQGFVRIFLQSTLYRESIAAGSRGIGINNLKKETLSNLFFPLPPLAEQHRIVAKVDELMALCDELEAARTERETKRERLAAASLARLNTPDPETFRDDARFALDALPALTARPDQIKQLRQTILNLAVRGKLVPQDQTDEPAVELLKRIAGKKADKTRRAELRRNGLPDASLRREEGLEPCNWTWTQLGEVALSMRYGTSVKCDYGTKGAPVLRIPNVSGGRISLDDIKFGPLSPTEIQDLSLLAGDILLIRSNGSLEIVGRAAVVTPDAIGMSFAGYLVRLRTDPTEIDPAYIWLSLQSSEVRDQIEQPIRSAVGLKNVNLTEFGALTFRLPPLAEQHRIVAKVDELMALCDELETSLTIAVETRKKLLDALLAEALAPVDADALQEAAE